jgi:site-specific recombinase XerD
VPQQPVRKQRHSSDRPNIVSMPTPKDGWESALGRFLSECRRRNLSTATLENYEWWLGGPRLTEFRREQNIQRPGDFTAAHLKAFEMELVDGDLKPSSIDSAHRHIKNFIGYCLREGDGGDEAVLRIAGPKLGKAEPETFTAGEEKALKAALKDRPRDLMLVELMLATGLRLREVANLSIDDVMESPQGAYLRVRQGKGKKDRAVPLDTPKDRLSSRLRRYVEKDRPRVTTERTLFLSTRKGATSDVEPLTADAIQTLMKRLSEETGIHVNPHKFRHTFATRALSAGVDVMALQKALGHTTLAMVSRYVHYQKDDLLDAWRQRRD